MRLTKSELAKAEALLVYPQKKCRSFDFVRRADSAQDDDFFVSGYSKVIHGLEYAP